MADDVAVGTAGARAWTLAVPKLLWQAPIVEALLKRITVDPEICHGKPTVRGLRYPVSMILELLAGGMSREEIIADYPDLEPDDIAACLTFGARLSDVQRVVRIAA